MNPTIKANPKGARASFNQSMVPTATPQSVATPTQTSNAPISPMIEASRLNTSSVAVPAPVTSNTAQTRLNGTLGTIAQGLEMSAKEQPTTPVEPPKPTLRETITDRLSSILNLQGTQADRTAELQKEQGLFEKQQIVTDLENQYRAKERFYTKEEEKIRKNSEGKTATAIEQDVATLQRQRNSELADIAIQQQAASGNYRTAFDIVEAKIDAEFEPLKNEIETLKTMYSFYQNDLTESEKLQAQARIQEKESALAFERNKEMARYEQQLRQSDPLYQAQVRKAQADAVAAETPVTISSGQFASVVDAASNLVGAEGGKTSRAAINNALSSGDYSSAFALIANNVEESLTGDVKTKFANARTDYAILDGMREAVQAYTDAGGDTGFLKGTADQIARRFGQLKTDPQFAALAVQLEREFQSYRQNMTGAAFSPGESREYASVNPRTSASLDLNLATITGAQNQLENRITSTINTRVPGANALYETVSGNKSESNMTDEEAYQLYLNSQ